MRILYVEDNPANLFLIRRVAKIGQHEVMNYIDGEEVLRKIDVAKPDLILMDIQLAGDMTGLDVVRELRKKGYTLPIIAVTAYAMVGDRERCLEAGCDDYVAKPLPINRMVEIFETYQKDVDAAEKRRTETQEAASVATEVAADDAPTSRTAEILAIAASALRTDTVPTINQQEDVAPATLTLAAHLFDDHNTSDVDTPIVPAGEKNTVREENKEENKIEEKKRATSETVSVLVKPTANNND